MKKTDLFVGGAFLAGLALGTAAGAKLVEKKLADQFERRLELETAQMKVYYTVSSANAAQKYATPEEAVKALIPEEVKEVLEEYQGNPKRDDNKVAYHKIKVSNLVTGEKTEEEPTQVNQNVFEKDDDLGPIYVITEAEFNDEESEYMQTMLTWYAGDCKLVDIHDDIIDDPAKVIGTAEPATVEFGKHSDDPNTMHVRNTILAIDYEINRSMGYYVVEVLGEEPPVERPSRRINSGG
jgi:hypothetical protein